MTILPASAVARARPDGGGSALELAGLAPLMDLTAGREDVAVALLDGPVAVDHPELAGATIRAVAAEAGACETEDFACLHGTFVAGILAGRRGPAPGVCPACTVLLRPIFAGPERGRHEMPAATAADLAQAMRECIDSGARLINVSAALVHSTAREDQLLTETLDLACRRGVVVIAAAGNDGLVGGSAITRHPWVVPVVAYTRRGWPMTGSNLGRAIARHGIGAPGEDVVSLTPEGGTAALSGTSVAAPFATGAAALLWSLYPSASAADVRHALTLGRSRSRRQAAPPMMDAWEACLSMSDRYRGGDGGVRARP